MNVSSEALVLPLHHRDHQALFHPQSSMFMNAAPVAVSNKIKAIQTRRPRITLPSYYDFTEIRPLHINNANGITNSLTSFTNLPSDKLVDARLGRLATRRTPRPCCQSTASTANQQSSIWSTYNLPSGFPRQSQIISPIPPAAVANKPSTSNILETNRRSSRPQTGSRQPSTDQENSLRPADLRHKSLTKTKSSMPKACQRPTPKSKSPFTTSRPQLPQTLRAERSKQLNNANQPHNFIPLCESEDDDDDDIGDPEAEFEQYLGKAIAKCADWLIKYVIDKKYDDHHE